MSTEQPTRTAFECILKSNPNEAGNVNKLERSGRAAPKLLQKSNQIRGYRGHPRSIRPPGSRGGSGTPWGPSRGGWRAPRRDHHQAWLRGDPGYITARQATKAREESDRTIVTLYNLHLIPLPRHANTFTVATVNWLPRGPTCDADISSTLRCVSSAAHTGEG